MYGQISGFTLYLMFYAGVTVLSLIACCYLLLRRSNAIAPDITSPVRLRRWTAAYFAAATLSHLWFLTPSLATSEEVAKRCILLTGLHDCATVFPLAIAILFVMLQDRRRPLWPVAAMVAPLVVGMVLCVARCSSAPLPMLNAYLFLMEIGLIIYMVRALRQYGRWLRDNFADLEHKEVWQSFIVLGILLLMFGIYTMSAADPDPVYDYVLQLGDIMQVCYLVWRVETLSDLSILQPQTVPAESGTPIESGTPAELDTPDKQERIESRKKPAVDIGLLLQRHCIKTQLYLQHDLTLVQLAEAIGTNRYYLSQYFSSLGTTYNAYINDLRINHFIRLYRETTTAMRPVTALQLANDSGYRSYSTFSLAFKQRTGQTVTAWIRDTAQQ